MAQRKVLVPGVGEVILAKRRGSTHLRLSVTAKGIVRVGMPYWTPYGVGINFARNRAEWIAKQLKNHQLSDFKSGDKIGKAHRLYITHNPGLAKPASRVNATEIHVNSPYEPVSRQTQTKVIEAANRALKTEAEKLLPQRLEILAQKHGYKYAGVKIRALTSRWGSCSSKKVITLSYYLVQLPWNLIDYVLLHELVHTRHMNHSTAFWSEFEQLMPGAKRLRKEVNVHKPQARPNSDF